ncbi:ArsR family transcriptional regulator [Egibacter rhizosphaerae]|uniref:ArsR family transcriptional regulator n=1 Tax=Egibacter rhizosphaerae TaxID=1670831 RepID=A0A411YIS2_9ACTN|nr:metalloregulator ArsR/SmtB family transcription factor [Egibacter rhizosphaerae]QBI21194.1 ArsR family transcriptional regulator [Egibacter rhizosphaerae]
MNDAHGDPSAQEAAVDAVFAALADGTRRDVVARLAQAPATATELAAALPVSRQAIAKHLDVLEHAGLVQRTREGRAVRYHLTPAPLGPAMAWMVDVGAEWDGALARLAVLAAEEESWQAR